MKIAKTFVVMFITAISAVLIFFLTTVVVLAVLFWNVLKPHPESSALTAQPEPITIEKLMDGGSFARDDIPPEVWAEYIKDCGLKDN